MKKCLNILGLLLFLWGGGGLRAQDQLTDLEGLVKIWTGLRQEIANEKRDWAEQQRFLRAEIALVNQEIAALENEIQQFEAEANSGDRKREEQLFRKQELAQGMASLQPMLDRVSLEVRALQAGLPPSLAPQVIFPEKTRVVDRVQAVAVALGILESLFGEIHVVKEMIDDGGGGEREMEVLYLGQSRAFAVAAHQDWAAIGTPGAGGWQWASAPEAASQIAQAIAIYQQQAPADLVLLPLQILPEDGGQP